MKSLSQAGLEAGYAMNRFNMRSCGPGMATECPTLYNGGLTDDLMALLRTYESEGRTPVYLVGFSLGGNVVLKLAGELGKRASRYVTAVCAVSTPIHLGKSAERIGRLDNRIYERRFLRRMIERLMATGKYTQRDFSGVNSIVSIDDKITAPFFGFRGAQHYYETQSATQFLDSITVPTLLIQAKDDTFIPFEIFKHPALQTNPNLTLIATERGGHLGFIARRKPRFWVDGQILKWLRRHPAAAD
jgi:predicted alpha/beta-fold hydrolase